MKSNTLFQYVVTSTVIEICPNVDEKRWGEASCEGWGQWGLGVVGAGLGQWEMGLSKEGRGTSKSGTRRTLERLEEGMQTGGGDADGQERLEQMQQRRRD